MTEVTKHLGYAVAKRSLDVAVTSLGLVCLAPVIAVIATLVRVRLGRSVMFRQTRAGLWGKPFTIVKFRTMLDARDHDDRILPDELRMTRLGEFLRRTSLDELPTLWNVLRGEMSLVGPRPLLVEYLPLYSAAQARRHDVKPGITGWAQVHGRNNLSWEEKFRHDIWYVQNRSLFLDIRILLRTVVAVLSRKGVSATVPATMSPFTGQSMDNLYDAA